jgi:hypothetical protein
MLKFWLIQGIFGDSFRISNVSGDLRTGNVFPQPVRTPVKETFPLFCEPPGNS